MILFATGYALAFLINTAFGLYLIARDPRAQTSRTLFALCILVSLIAFSQFETVMSESISRAYFWYGISRVWPLVLSILLHFAAVCGRQPTERLSWVAGVAIHLPAVVLSVVLFTLGDGQAAELVRVNSYWAVGHPDMPSAAVIAIIVASTLYSLLTVGLSIRCLVRARTRQEYAQRAFILAGVMVGIATSALSYAVLPSLGVLTPDIATYGFAVSCMLFSFAIRRYHLFQVDLIAAAEHVVRVMPSTMVLLDNDHRIVRTNEAGSLLLGIHRDQASGRDFLSLFSEPDAQAVLGILAVGPAGNEASVDVDIRSVGSNPVPVAISAASVTTGRGRRLGTVCVIRNLSGERRAEVARRNLEERLSQAEKLEAIGRLAGGVAHDFNNILAGIMGYADLIKADCNENDSRTQEYVGHVIDGSKRAARLVSNLLTFARKKPVNVETVDLREVVRDVVSLVEHTIDRRIDISVDEGHGSSNAMADSSQIHNAVLNLAINARDAIDGHGEIRISVGRRDIDATAAGVMQLNGGPGHYVFVSVSDTGTGISRDSLGRVFDPFYTTKEVGKGTGLGLASVYGTAQACGGTVEAESEKGTGSTFTIYLPAGHDEVRPDVPDIPDAGTLTAGILVIDDEEPVRKVITRALESMGHTVRAFGDSDAALAHAKAHPDTVELVVLDLNMPGRSGFEVLDLLTEWNPGLPVLVATGLLTDGQNATELGERVAGFIQKPFDFGELEQLVDEVLRSSGSGATPQ